MSKPRTRKIKIFLHNDSVNSFANVITVLTHVLPHCNPLRAESIATITHNAGKCQIFYGRFDESIYLYSQLIKHGLHVSVQ